MKKVNQLIIKAIMEEDFRKEFLADPMKAAESFEISENELAYLRELDLSELEQINTELEERLSKSFINLPTLSYNSSRWHNSHSNSINDPLHTSSGGDGPGHESFGENDGHDSSSHSSW